MRRRKGRNMILWNRCSQELPSSPWTSQRGAACWNLELRLHNRCRRVMINRQPREMKKICARLIIALGVDLWLELSPVECVAGKCGAWRGSNSRDSLDRLHVIERPARDQLDMSPDFVPWFPGAIGCDFLSFFISSRLAIRSLALLLHVPFQFTVY